MIASTFEEDLPQSDFEDPHEYPVATATQKAIEVYQRLVVCHVSIDSHISSDCIVKG